MAITKFNLEEREIEEEKKKKKGNSMRRELYVVLNTVVKTDVLYRTMVQVPFKEGRAIPHTSTCVVCAINFFLDIFLK
jgi:hypothetical protein